MPRLFFCRLVEIMYSLAGWCVFFYGGGWVNVYC